MLRMSVSTASIVSLGLVAGGTNNSRCATALRSLAAEPGGLLRGVVPSVTRGALMAASQLASYDHSKHVGKRHLVAVIVITCATLLDHRDGGDGSDVGESDTVTTRMDSRDGAGQIGELCVWH